MERINGGTKHSATDSQAGDGHATARPVSGLFVLGVNGAAGAGKTTTLNFWQREYGILAVPKLTDRPSRVLSYFSPGESVCVSPAEFTLRTAEPDFFWYVYGERRYGVSIKDIVARLRESRVVAFVFNSHPFLHSIKTALQGVARVECVHIEIHPHIILPRLRAEGTPEQEIMARVNRPRPHGGHYHTHPHLYAHVVDNNRDKAWLETQLRTIAQHYVSAATTAQKPQHNNKRS